MDRNRRFDIMCHDMDKGVAGMMIGKYLEELAAREGLMCNKGVGELLVIVYARPGLERCVGRCGMVDLP